MDIEQLEYYCEQLYTTASPDIREQAEKACSGLPDRNDCLAVCKLLLDRSRSCYAQLIASTTLSKYISNRDAVIPVSTRLELRDYILGFIVNHQVIEKFVQQSLISLVCRLTKAGWFDFPDDVVGFRDILTHCSGFIESGQSRMVLVGIQLLNNMVLEMNRNSESDMTRVIFRQRKLSASFRDTLLLPIFRLGLNLLREADKNMASLNLSDTTQHDILGQSLQLIHSCLTYDFIGTTAGTGRLIVDETFSGSEEVIIQIPTTWRAFFLDPDLVLLFFRLFNGLSADLSVQVLSCVVQLTSIRRSLFTNAERLVFSSKLVSGACDILSKHSSQLANPQTYHEFCRFLSRLKSAFQITELVSIDSYSQFLELLTAFTIHTIKARPLGSENNNCLHYLLMLWQRLVVTITYIQSPESDRLKDAASQVASAYVETCLGTVTEYSNKPIQTPSVGAENISTPNHWGTTSSKPNLNDEVEISPLDDVTTLVQQLEQFAVIGRCKYEKTCSQIVQLFEAAATSYEKALTMVMPGGPLDNNISQLISLDEHRLAWLVYMTGALIGCRVNYTSADDDCDGELICRVLKLMQLTNNRLAMMKATQVPPDPICRQLNRSPGSMRLELAILSFLEHFRKLYVGESVSRMSRVYQRVAEVLGIGDDLMILSLFTTKILTNLKYWDAVEPILTRTVSLLSEISKNYTALRKMLKLDDAKFLLSSHRPENFPFLSIDPNLSDTPSSAQIGQFRLRTTFYSSLTRLLMVELGEDDRSFLAFMQPLTHSANQLIAALFSDTPSNLTPNQVKYNVIALARDLRGISFSLNSTCSYQFFLDWFYPSGFRLFGRALELWSMDPVVSVPVLKLLAEIVNNRNGRLLFDCTIPTGYLLFTEISRILNAFAAQLLSHLKNVNNASIYTHKLKPIMAVWSVLKVCLSGNFINFGVFSLFQVDSLEKAIEAGIQLLMCIEHSELEEYPKVSDGFFGLLECLLKEHAIFVVSLGENLLGHILSAISKNILSINSQTAEYCCECLDYIVSLLYKVEQSSAKLQDQQHGNADNTTGVSGRLLSIEDGRVVDPDHASSFSSVRRYGASSYAVWSTRVASAETNLAKFFQRYGPSRRELFRILVVLFAAVMLEDCRIQWSVTQPMLPLIALNYQEFVELLRQVTRSLPSERETAVVGLLEKLMDGVDGRLTTKAREKFTQNVSSFKHALGEYVKSASARKKNEVLEPVDGGNMNDESSHCMGDYFCLSSAVLKASELNLSMS